MLDKCEALLMGLAWLVRNNATPQLTNTAWAHFKLERQMSLTLLDF